jgi:TnpA family transposase
MAHGCNIGPYTMARLTEEALRQALAQLVNALSGLAVTQTWGEGKTSSSDGQRFRFRRKVLQRTYSHRLNDYALESFVIDSWHAQRQRSWRGLQESFVSGTRP